VFTDPPYNVDYEGYTEEKLKIKSDAMPAEDFNAFLLAVFASCRTAIEPNAGMYVCHASSVQREFQTAIEAAGFEVRTSSTSPSSIATWTGRPMRGTATNLNRPCGK
jgi:DNA modification methylase